MVSIQSTRLSQSLVNPSKAGYLFVPPFFILSVIKCQSGTFSVVSVLSYMVKLISICKSGLLIWLSIISRNRLSCLIDCQSSYFLLSSASSTPFSNI